MKNCLNDRKGAKFDVIIFHSYLRIRKINLTKICYYGLSASCASWMSSVNIHKKKLTHS